MTVLVSPDAFQSDWVGDELDYALKLLRQRQQVVGAEAFPVIPLTLDGTRLGAFKRLFAADPAWIPISSAPGGIDAALHAILVALGRRLPNRGLFEVPVVAPPVRILLVTARREDDARGYPVWDETDNPAYRLFAGGCR